MTDAEPLAPGYDHIGRSYRKTRQADPKIAAALADALGGATSVVNVGAGTGSYEPPTTVLAVEPSSVMIAQRPHGSAPAIQASAENLPLPDNYADAALALFTVHHWADLEKGLTELRRVARHRVVVTSWLPAIHDEFWLFRDYLPELGAWEKCRVLTIHPRATTELRVRIPRPRLADVDSDIRSPAGRRLEVAVSLDGARAVTIRLPIDGTNARESTGAATGRDSASA